MHPIEKYDVEGIHRRKRRQLWFRQRFAGKQWY
jgi:hypothetical protein